jgi:hypothetical protein
MACSAAVKLWNGSVPLLAAVDAEAAVLPAVAEVPEAVAWVLPVADEAVVADVLQLSQMVEAMLLIDMVAVPGLRASWRVLRPVLQPQYQAKTGRFRRFAGARPADDAGGMRGSGCARQMLPGGGRMRCGG